MFRTINARQSDLNGGFVIQEHGEGVSVCYAYYFALDGVLFL